MSTPTRRTAWDLDPEDEASRESFPASDPPAWMSASAHASASEDTVCPPELEPEVATQRPDHLKTLRRIALGFGALGALLSFVEGVRRVRER